MFLLVMHSHDSMVLELPSSSLFLSARSHFLMVGYGNLHMHMPRFEVAGKHPERELQKDDLNILRMTRNQIFNGVI